MRVYFPRDASQSEIIELTNGQHALGSGFSETRHQVNKMVCDAFRGHIDVYGWLRVIHGSNELNPAANAHMGDLMDTINGRIHTLDIDNTPGMGSTLAHDAFIDIINHQAIEKVYRPGIATLVAVGLLGQAKHGVLSRESQLYLLISRPEILRSKGDMHTWKRIVRSELILVA